MIDLYFWPTPNGWKISIMLEETGLPWRLVPVNIGKGEQFTPGFLAISPNNRMPAIVDHEPAGEAGPVSLFESGAILLYLAAKAGRFAPTDAAGRRAMHEWLFWQVGNLGPMGGQLSHFVNYAPGEHPYSLARYQREYDRCLGVLDRRLAGREFILGEYSIVDMACWPWLVPYRHLGQSLDHLPNVAAWHARMKARPAVRAGVDAGKEFRRQGPPDDAERKLLFEQDSQATRPRTGDHQA